MHFAALPVFLIGLFPGIPFAAPVISPFFSTNQNPIIQVHSLPAMGSAQILAEDGRRYRLVHELASHYTVKNTLNESLLFDGETNRSTFVYTRGEGKGWEWGAQIPYVRHGPGSLDSFIEDWHDTFGLPQGGRDTAPRNQLLYRYQRNGVTELLLNERTGGVGDLRLTAGKQWQTERAGEANAGWLALRAALSLPTGDSDALSGSGATELALWATANRSESWFGYAGNLFGGGGLLLMGSGEVLTDQQRRLAAFASLGAGAQVLPWLALKLQADIHSALYNKSSLKQINATAVQLLMGGDVRLSKQLQLSLMVSEDLTVGASPDVVFHVGLLIRP